MNLDLEKLEWPALAALVGYMWKKEPLYAVLGAVIGYLIQSKMSPQPAPAIPIPKNSLPVGGSALVPVKTGVPAITGGASPVDVSAPEPVIITHGAPPVSLDYGKPPPPPVVAILPTGEKVSGADLALIGATSTLKTLARTPTTKSPEELHALKEQYLIERERRLQQERDIGLK